mmetsp:Transcript_36583/g.82455  ORF Transcript_36583/g.82455 Transcript_36583/m.82455 type:complete len:1389 (-) Transcript_36583:94-4260(-)
MKAFQYLMPQSVTSILLVSTWLSLAAAQTQSVPKGPDGTPCTDLPDGCMICPAPIISPAANSGNDESGVPVSVFQQSVAVSISLPSGSLCTLMCWSTEYVLQTGMQTPYLPRLPIDCGGNPCGNPQNDCVDISKKAQSLTAFSTSSYIRARLYNFAYKLASPESTMKYINSLDLVAQVRCGDGITVNPQFDKSVTINQEQCDDGNTRANDGCDSSCHVEPGWTCRPASNTSSLAVCTPPDSYPNSTNVNETAVFTRLGVPLVVTFCLLVVALFLWKQYPQAYHMCLRKYASAGLEVKDDDEVSQKRLTFKERKELREKERMKNENRMEVAKELKSRLMNWNLRLTVIEARNLPKADVFIRDSQLCGLADPYVTVKIDGEGRRDKRTYRTDICKSTLCPYWNKEFSLQFDEEEDQIVLDVWDWDAGKNDDWLGVVRLTGNYMISGWQWGPGEGRSGSGGLQNAYEEDAWFGLVDRKGRIVRNLESKRTTELHLKFRIDKTNDPVVIVESLMHYKAEQKKKEQDHIIGARQVLVSLQRYCGKNNLNVDMLAVKMDEDGSGSLDKDELLVGLNRIGFDISPEKINDIFLMYGKQRMLDQYGNIPTSKFCDSIGVSNSGGLVQAIKQHVTLAKGQLHKLQEENVETFHTPKTHPTWWEGCTCGDQWICGECGTWHRYGKRVWSWKEGFLEDLQCRQCSRPRPDPLPKVPCKYLVKEDYYRIAGNKPIEKMNFGTRDSLIIRVQDEERLQIYDEPTWKLGYKIQNLERKTANQEFGMEEEETHVNRESIVMGLVEDPRKKAKRNTFVLPDGTWADTTPTVSVAPNSVQPQRISEAEDEDEDEDEGEGEMTQRPDTPEIDTMFEMIYRNKQDQQGFRETSESIELMTLKDDSKYPLTSKPQVFQSISVDIVTASPQKPLAQDSKLVIGKQSVSDSGIERVEEEQKLALPSSQSFQVFTHRLETSRVNKETRIDNLLQTAALEKHSLRELLKMRRENVMEEVMNQRKEENLAQQREKQAQDKSIKIAPISFEAILEQKKDEIVDTKDDENLPRQNFQSLNQLMIAATRSVRSEQGITTIVPSSRNQAMLWAEKLVIHPAELVKEGNEKREKQVRNPVSDLSDNKSTAGVASRSMRWDPQSPFDRRQELSAMAPASLEQRKKKEEIILSNHVSILGGEGNTRGYNQGHRFADEDEDVPVELVTRPRSLGGGAYGIMFDLRARRKMTVRALYSGCGLEEECEVKVWVYVCGGTYRGKEEASHMWTLVGCSESFRMPPADCEAAELQDYAELPLDEPVDLLASETKGVCIMTSRPRGLAVREGQKVLPGRLCVGSKETYRSESAEMKEGARTVRRVKEGLELLAGSLVTSPFLFSQTSKVYGAFAGGVVYYTSRDDLV